MTTVAKSALALQGGTPVRGEDKVWPGWPCFDDTERKALNEVLESGKWFFGERVAQFEKDYAEFQDAQFCVTCNSGTTAAEIAMQALGIGPGDEVLVPAYTFIATASSVARVGATPIFVDVNESWCMDPALAEAAITPRTKAHYAGAFRQPDLRHGRVQRLGREARSENHRRRLSLLGLEVEGQRHRRTGFRWRVQFPGE